MLKAVPHDDVLFIHNDAEQTVCSHSHDDAGHVAIFEPAGDFAASVSLDADGATTVIGFAGGGRNRIALAENRGRFSLMIYDEAGKLIRQCDPFRAAPNMLDPLGFQEN